MNLLKIMAWLMKIKRVGNGDEKTTEKRKGKWLAQQRTK